MNEDNLHDEAFVVTPFPEPRRARYHSQRTVAEAFQRLIDILEWWTRKFCAKPKRRIFGGLPSAAWHQLKTMRKLDGNTRRVPLPDNVPGTLNDLFYAIEWSMELAYREGVRDGTNLLQQLASGEITLSEISAIRESD